LPRILYGVSPIGLGHATRSQVVVEELRKQGAEVRLFSGGRAAEYFRQVGMIVDDVVDDPVPSVSHLTMNRVVLWYIRSWFANRRTVKRAERLFDEFAPDLVVCDEEFSGVTVAGWRGIKRVFIADELRLGFARTWLARKVEGRVERWYQNLQRSVELLIIPEEGVDTGNRRHVGPIVRARTLTCEETRSKHGLPPGKMVLFSASGSGIGLELAERVAEALKEAQMGGAYLVVTGNRGSKLAALPVYDLGVVPDNQNLVACADIVVSTAGKSTIDEAASAGTPIIVVPIRHHAEQERNAKSLGYDFDAANHLGELVAAKIGRRETPRSYTGGQRASQLILSMA
jgi:UDP-N-acetylglucosamine--N-acetylmuramyl-(pentapeptide) pyrophosphoryl-undecaprenol N-acetylglucosamine transferase